MIEEHHAYRRKDKVINELLGRIALLERAIEEKEEVIEEVREYIKRHREAVDERGEHIIYFLKDNFDEEDILKILKGE